MNEVVEFQNLQSREGHTFDKEELIDFGEEIQKKNCQILTTGLKESEGMYYICECDPERINAICEDCFMSCHKGGNEGLHREIRKEKMRAVCVCGYRCHRPLSESGTCDTSYKTICTFGEVAAVPDLNFVFQSLNESDKYVCLFCYNICYKQDESLVKRNISELKGFKCNCTKHTHFDLKIMFRKLRSLVKGDNFLLKYDFKGMCLIQAVNIFANMKHTFKNLFHSFENMINSTYNNLKNTDYSFEEHNSFNDLHSTCQVLFSYCQKFKNEYILVNKIIENNKKNEDNIMANKIMKPQKSKKRKNTKNATILDGKMEFVKIKLKTLCYLSDNVRQVLSAKIYFKIMERKFDYKSRNIWQLKYFLTSIFYTFYIQRDFCYYPSIKLKDIALLSPLQRLTLISNIENETKVSNYVNNLNMNYLSETLNIIEILTNCEERTITVYLILSKLYKICLLFARFSLFNHEQLSKFCKLNDSLLAIFDEEKPQNEKDFIKLQVISPMAKSLLYLSYYYNDQMILSFLKGERKLENVNFVHCKSDFAKNISQNVIVILSFTQRFGDDNAYNTLVKNIKGQLLNANAKPLPVFRKSSTIMKMSNLSADKPKTISNLRMALNCCNDIITLFLGINEFYFSTLVRLIEPGSELIFKYLRNNLLPKEKEFIKKTKYLTEELEGIYFNFLKSYNSKENEERFNQKFEDIINQYDKNLNLVHENIKKKKEEDLDDDKLLDHQSEDNINNDENNIENNTSKGEKEKENSDIKNETSSMNPDSINSYSYLTLKTFFLQSTMKFFHIMYLNHISKKLVENEFTIKQNIFRAVIEMLYNLINFNVENSFFILQSDFTSNFELLNGSQLVDALNLVYTALTNIKLSKRDLPSNSNLIHLIKVGVIKGYNVEVLNQVLKIMQKICKLHLADEEGTKRKLRRVCKIIFNYHTLIAEYFDILGSRETDRLKAFNKDTEQIVKKFMRVINVLFVGNQIVIEKAFLDSILTKEKLKKILYAKTINISLRTELIEFYRNNFLETVLNKSDINYFMTILINDFQIDKKEEIIENPKYYKFFEYLVKSGLYSTGANIENEANVVKFELLNFQEVLTMTTNKKKIKKYIQAITKAMIVYFNKFSSLIFESSGISLLSIYELIVYFLELKKFIYSRGEIFDNNDEVKKKILFVNSLQSNVDKDSIIFNLDKSNKDSYRLEYFDKKEDNSRFGKKKKKNLKIIPKTDEEKVLYDLLRMNDENFQFLNFTEVRNIFLSHTKNFITIPMVTGFKDIFEKKTAVYEEDKVDKMKAFLKKEGRYKSSFDKNIFDIILKYANTKVDIDKGSFIKVLEESSTHFNTTYRNLFCKTMLFLLVYFNEKHRNKYLWFLFRLLQYDTTGMQQTFIDIKEASNNANATIFDFNKLINSFTDSIITVIIREINPTNSSVKDDYYNAVMSVKIMKYFCEEHNNTYQTFFFNNKTLEPGDLVVRYKSRLKIRRQVGRIGMQPTVGSSGSGQIQMDGSSPSNFLASKKFTEFFGSKKISVFSNNSNASKIEGEEYDKEASVFEYLLSILGKIILLSKWMSSKDENPDDYFYDIYFTILEFLVETIQGTSSDNLAKIFTTEKKSKRLFAKTLTEVNKLLIDDSFDSDLNYTIRKDMTDFIMAFLEESATPSCGIIEISSVLLPASILDSIIATMCKLYEERMEEKKEEKNDDDEDEDDDDDQKNNNNNNNQANKENSAITGIDVKRVFTFTPEMKDYFTEEYFTAMELEEDEKFQLANRLYQYFKMLGQSGEFKNPFVGEFYLKMEMFSDSQVKNTYYNKSDNLVNKITGAEITDQKFYDQFLCVSFFESITRTVFVKKEDEDESVSVIFTINPIVPLLSKISKDDFIENVDRTDRYTKLFSLLERCDNFFEEISYKQVNGKTNCLVNLIADINFYYLEVIAFLITLTINIIMLIVLKGEGVVLYGDEKVDNILLYLGLVNLVFNALSVILWILSKFSLLYMTESQKIIKEKLRLIGDNEEEDEKEISLNCWEKIQATYIILGKGKLFCFFWNIVFSALGAFLKNYFIYICQLLIIFNLSSTLRNLLESLTYKKKQLTAVFYCSVIVNLCLASVAFLNFEEDFMNVIDSKMPHDYPKKFEFLKEIIGSTYTEPAHIESECGTLAYCFATHLDYGMRFDGGIADRMGKRSYNINKGFYLARFFYEEVYFISQTVLLQGMLFGIVIEAFSELRSKEIKIEEDKEQICFICGIDKVTCEKNGQKFENHTSKDHNLWTYVEYILGLRFIDIQETNAINSYVMEKIEKRELTWFPIQKAKNDNGGEENDD